MDPRLKALVVLLVGAAIGAAVAGGALSYVKGDPQAQIPIASTPSSSAPIENVAEAVEEPTSDEAVTTDPAPRERERPAPKLAGDGPDATVSTDPTVAPAPSPRVRTVKKTPVVEEDGEGAKSSDEALRDEEPKESKKEPGSKETTVEEDGGSIR